VVDRHILKRNHQVLYVLDDLSYRITFLWKCGSQFLKPKPFKCLVPNQYASVRWQQCQQFVDKFNPWIGNPVGQKFNMARFRPLLVDDMERKLERYLFIRACSIPKRHRNHKDRFKIHEAERIMQPIQELFDYRFIDVKKLLPKPFDL